MYGFLFSETYYRNPQGVYGICSIIDCRRLFTVLKIKELGNGDFRASVLIGWMACWEYGEVHSVVLITNSVTANRTVQNHEIVHKFLVK